MPPAANGQRSFVVLGMKIRNQKYHRSPGGNAIQKIERLLQICFSSLRFEVKNLADQSQDMESSLSGRNVKLHSIGEQNQPDFVVVSNSAKCQQARDFCSQFSLAGVDTAVAARSTHVDQKHDRQFAFFDILSNVRFTHARRYVPIDRSNFVAEIVLPELIKIHSASLKDAVVLAGEGG